MTIESAAYQLAKDVRGSPQRAALRDVLHNLNVSSEAQPDGGLFGYYARRQRIQFYGYLLLDQLRGELASQEPPMLVPSLTEEERKVLLAAHSQVQQFNAKATQDALSLLPNAFMVLDPYGGLRPLANRWDGQDPLVPPEVFEPLIAAFRNHPALAALRARSLGALTSVRPEAILQTVQTFEKSLYRAGPLAAPSDFTRLINDGRRMSPERQLARLFVALMCLRASVRAVDQMIYQAAQHDKLSVISGENVINISESVSHYAGLGMRAAYQPLEQMWRVDAGELLLVKHLPEGRGFDGLCVLERVSHEFSQELGASTTVELRRLDEHLDPYAPLRNLL